MPKHCLYLDFGATRIKWVLESERGKEVSLVGEISNPYIRKGFMVEIDLKKLFSAVKRLVLQLHASHKLDTIMISSQMHGFAIAHNKGKFLTNYISWMDQRFYNLQRKEYDIFLKEHSSLFSEKSGMSVKSGLPYFNSIPILKSIGENNLKILSLPEIILSFFGVKEFKAHATMLAGSGFYDIYKKEISSDLVNIHKKYTGKNVFFSEVSYGFDAYNIKIGKSQVEISIGFGDHQCAVLGAENDKNTISLNLGTGSQISQIVDEKKARQQSKKLFLQKRPFFGNDYLICVTHIPSGRVLNQFLEIFNIFSPDKKYWNDIQKLTLKDLDKANLNFNLSVFNDAWGYINGGSISNMQEGDINYKNYIASLINSYIRQYVTLVNTFDEHLGAGGNKIVLSGGIPQRISVIKKQLSKKLNKQVIQKEISEEKDEAVSGLKTLYVRHYR